MKQKQYLELFWRKLLSKEDGQILASLLEENKEVNQQEGKVIFDQIVKKHQNGGLSDADAERIKNELNEKINNLYQPKVRKIGWWSVAAASIFVILSVALLFHKKDAPKQANQNVQVPHLPKTEYFENNTNNIQPINLPDGSLAKLYPKSNLRLDHNYSVVKRDLYLDGKAEFKVAKDKTHPFTVYANKVGTTALGTIFWVDSKNPDIVKVKLLEGKIVVRYHKGNTILSQYLTVGQQFDVQTNTAPITIQQQSLKKPVAIIFDQEELASVFAKLSTKWQVPIEYGQANIKGMKFSGSFKSTDKLDAQLDIICTMNGLNYEHKNGSIIINNQ